MPRDFEDTLLPSIEEMMLHWSRARRDLLHEDLVDADELLRLFGQYAREDFPRLYAPDDRRFRRGTAAAENAWGLRASRDWPAHRAQVR